MKPAFAIIALAACGCALIGPPKRPAWTTFVLESGADGARTPATAGAPAGEEASARRTIRVAPVESAGGYDTPQMAYSRAAGELEYYARHRWAEPPAQMLAPRLTAALEQSGTFAAVIAPSSRANADLLLETELLAFRMQFESTPTFRATLRATVVNEVDGLVAGSARTFDVVEPMAEANPAAGAKAAERAVARLVAEVAAFCGEAAKI